MADMYCCNCNQNVGVKKERSCGTIGLIVTFFILGLIVPFWFISLPIFWGLSLVVFIFSGKKTCGKCGGTRLDPQREFRVKNSSLASKPEEEFIGSSDDKEGEVSLERSEGE